MTFAGDDESTFFHRLDRISIGRQRAYFFIIFQLPQNRVAAERICFKLVSVFHVRQQVLFSLGEFRRHASSFLLRHLSSPEEKSALRLRQSEGRRLGSATDTIPLPQAKPRAMRERFIVPSICSRDVAGAERSDVRRFEHFLYLFNIVNDAFNVHAPQSSRKRRLAVNPKRRSAVNPKRGLGHRPAEMEIVCIYEYNRMAPQVGLEPTTLRLTAECSAIELLRSVGNRARAARTIFAHSS